MSTYTPLKTGIYLRISEDRHNGAGVERQEKECRELAARLGWPVADVFTDNDISASSFSRKIRTDYQRLVEAIQAGRIDSVITWHSDRMFRRPDEHEQYIKLCQTHDINNAAVRVGDIDYDTPSGRFNARMQINMAAYESEHKAERLQSKHRQIAEAGGWKGGIRPFGYEPDGMTVRESEAAEVRRIANAVIRGQSLRSLAVELNSRGIKTVTGRKPWTSAHLRSMLMHARVAGLREHRGRIVCDAAWPAILERHTWEAMKDVLADPKRRTGGSGRRGRVPTSLGTSMYLCGQCHEPRLRLGRSNGRRPVYKCGNAEVSSGAHVSRVADKLDAYVEGALLEIISRPAAVEAMCAVIDSDDTELAKLSQEQATIRPRLNKAAMRYEAGDIDDEQLSIISKGLHARNAEITSILSAAQMRSPLDVLLGVESVERIWDEHLTMGQKRAILAEVLTVTVLPATGGGRAPDGSYFNSDSVHIELTDRARARLEPMRSHRPT